MFTKKTLHAAIFVAMAGSTAFAGNLDQTTTEPNVIAPGASDTTNITPEQIAARALEEANSRVSPAWVVVLMSLLTLGAAATH